CASVCHIQATSSESGAACGSLRSLDSARLATLLACSIRAPDLVLVHPALPVQPRLRVRDEFPAFSEPLRIAAHSRPEVFQDLVGLGVEPLSGPHPLCSGFAYPPRVRGPEFVEAIGSALARVFFSALFCICSVLF